VDCHTLLEGESRLGGRLAAAEEGDSEVADPEGPQCGLDPAAPEARRAGTALAGRAQDEPGIGGGLGAAASAAASAAPHEQDRCPAGLEPHDLGRPSRREALEGHTRQRGEPEEHPRAAQGGPALGVRSDRVRRCPPERPQEGEAGEQHPNERPRRHDPRGPGPPIEGCEHLDGGLERQLREPDRYDGRREERGVAQRQGHHDEGQHRRRRDDPDGAPFAEARPGPRQRRERRDESDCHGRCAEADGALEQDAQADPAPPSARAHGFDAPTTRQQLGDPPAGAWGGDDQAEGRGVRELDAELMDVRGLRGQLHEQRGSPERQRVRTPAALGAAAAQRREGGERQREGRPRDRRAPTRKWHEREGREGQRCMGPGRQRSAQGVLAGSATATSGSRSAESAEESRNGPQEVHRRPQQQPRDEADVEPGERQEVACARAREEVARGRVH
jgi:hypothetical protein